MAARRCGSPASRRPIAATARRVAHSQCAAGCASWWSRRPAQAVREAPASVFATWRELDPEGVTVEADGSGYALLPADFMRLLSFRMSDWRVAVERVDEARGACIGRLYPEAYASPSRPLCRFGQRPEGRVLLFAGSRSPAATLAQGLYVAQPRIDRRGTIDVPEELLADIALRMRSAQ